jgi:hypothetical protein
MLWTVFGNELPLHSGKDGSEGKNREPDLLEGHVPQSNRNGF